MKDIKPYLLRAYYEWMTDCELTPYLYINTTLPNISVPENLLAEKILVLNVSFVACQNLHIDDKSVNFSARFSGVVHDIYLPIDSVLALVTKEDSRGISFTDNTNPNSYEEISSPDADNSISDKNDTTNSKPKNKSKKSVLVDDKKSNQTTKNTSRKKPILKLDKR